MAARNILIQSDLTAKLCGLGLAYEVHAQGAISAARTVPLKWLAPERLLLRTAGIKGDMYGLSLASMFLPFMTWVSPLNMILCVLTNMSANEISLLGSHTYSQAEMLCDICDSCSTILL